MSPLLPSSAQQRFLSAGTIIFCGGERRQVADSFSFFFSSSRQHRRMHFLMRLTPRRALGVETGNDLFLPPLANGTRTTHLSVEQRVFGENPLRSRRQILAQLLLLLLLLELYSITRRRKSCGLAADSSSSRRLLALSPLHLAAF